MRVLKAIYYFFPVQLLLLHVKKFQVLLIFWLILFSTLNGGFMRAYGANALFLSPEYLGDVSAISAAIVGIATGTFIMSWNITTFILFSRHFRFLATTSKPFLKYCINNSLLPIIFLVFYLIKVLQFSTDRELLSPSHILWLCLGFLAGLALLIAVSLYYFFRADRSIIRRMTPVIALRRLTLTIFYILIFMAPMVISLLSAVFLREGVPWQRAVAIVTGFAGVIVAVHPWTGAREGDWIGFGACMVCVACFSTNMVWSRVLTQTEFPESLAFFSGIVTAVAETTLAFMHRDPGSAVAYRKAGFDTLWRALAIA